MTARRPKKGKGVGLMNNKLSAAARHSQKRHADKTERQAAAAELRAHHRGEE